ncbi:hypothetical protein [Roseimarinus sediminis]|jgi:hypothetical protein|uniref:hypothetical protein n=1 Tax=Roseimarinus sediminis TaxID=1610899 RepID=UPI003D2520BE
MSTICPNYEKCPIYSGILKDKVMTSKAYRQYFCESPDYKTCKRYLVKEATGVCPPDVLPNSHLSVQEIIERYHLAKA